MSQLVFELLEDKHLRMIEQPDGLVRHPCSKIHQRLSSRNYECNWWMLQQSATLDGCFWVNVALIYDRKIGAIE